MELSKSKLKQIIKEEIQRALAEKTKKFDLNKCLGNCPGGHNKPECPEDMGEGEGNQCRKNKRACEIKCRKKAKQRKVKGKITTPTEDDPLF